MKPVPRGFPLVCVGGSAGGSEAYAHLLKALPPDLGVAVVIVNHMTKTSATLHQILPRFTRMPVELITEGLPIQSNRVFIIPSNRDLYVVDGKFRLKPISKPKGWPDVITLFLRSIAQNWDGKLVAVIVSGLDSDGADALKSIKEAGALLSHRHGTHLSGRTCRRAR
jgi:two-component system chemotaxis response regulator CheB